MLLYMQLLRFLNILYDIRDKQWARSCFDLHFNQTIAFSYASCYLYHTALK